MKQLILLTSLLGALLMSGCNKEKAMSKDEMKKTAENVAVEYLKVEEDVDFVVDDIEFANGVGVESVSVNGHVKGHKEKEISVFLNTAQDFKVEGIGEN